MSKKEKEENTEPTFERGEHVTWRDEPAELCSINPNGTVDLHPLDGEGKPKLVSSSTPLYYAGVPIAEISKRPEITKG